MKLDKKNKLLIFAFVVLLYICYTFAVKNTIVYYSQYNSLKNTAEIIGYTPKQLAELSMREKHLDNALLKFNENNSTSFQNMLLKNIALLAGDYNLIIVNFGQPHIITDSKIKTSSYSFTIRGSFNGILLSVNRIENNPVLGYVKHISFIKKTDYKNNLDYLEATIILQKIEVLKD